MMDKFIYKATLVTAWAMLPIAIVCVAVQTAIQYVKRTIKELQND